MDSITFTPSPSPSPTSSPRVNEMLDQILEEAEAKMRLDHPEDCKRLDELIKRAEYRRKTMKLEDNLL